jgi:hypothetical protein
MYPSASSRAAFPLLRHCLADGSGIEPVSGWNLEEQPAPPFDQLGSVWPPTTPPLPIRWGEGRGEGPSLCSASHGILSIVA